MIKYQSIYLSFEGKAILQDFSLEIKRGDKVLILGPSGIGKTSLFSLVLGFVLPDKGQVFFNSELVDKRIVWNVRRKIAYVDQNASIGSGRVMDWFPFVSSLKANHRCDFSRERICELFSVFNLHCDFLKKDISQLSGGERQRIAIITAILLGRDVFFLDEATASLDKGLKKTVVDFFTQRPEWTVVSVSHDGQWMDARGVKIFDMEMGKWAR